MTRKRDLLAQVELLEVENAALRRRAYTRALDAIREDSTPTPAQTILARSVVVIQGLSEEIEELLTAYLHLYRFVQIEFEPEPYANAPTSYISTSSTMDRAAQRIARAWQEDHIRMMVTGFDPEIAEDQPVGDRLTGDEVQR